MNDSRPRGPEERDPTTDRGEHVPAAPFAVRPPGTPAWWTRPATAVEMAAHARLRAAQERRMRESAWWRVVT